MSSDGRRVPTLGWEISPTGQMSRTGGDVVEIVDVVDIEEAPPVSRVSQRDKTSRKGVTMPTHINDRLVSWASEIDDETIRQAEKTARLRIVEGHVALMPDAHLGMGATVGSVIPTRGAVIPGAVGVEEKRKRRDGGAGPDAFVDHEACRAYADNGTRRLDERVAEEKR